MLRTKRHHCHISALISQIEIALNCNLVILEALQMVSISACTCQLPVSHYLTSLQEKRWPAGPQALWQQAPDSKLFQQGRDICSSGKVSACMQPHTCSCSFLTASCCSLSSLPSRLPTACCSNAVAAGSCIRTHSRASAAMHLEQAC